MLKVLKKLLAKIKSIFGIAKKAATDIGDEIKNKGEY